MKKWKTQPIKQQRQRGPLPFRYVLLISLLVFAILTVLGLRYVDQQLRPVLTEIASVEIDRIANHAIHEALSHQLGDYDMSEMILIDENGTFQADSRMYNEVMGNAIGEVHSVLNQIQAGEMNSEGGEGDIVYSIPLGRALNNALLNDLGPPIPIRFQTVSDAKVDMVDEIERVGINNTRVSLSMEVDVRVQVILPFSVATENVSVTLPAGLAVIPGEVPNYYMEGGQGGSILPPAPAIPAEEIEQEENNGP
ncbi:sporulation protein YunB [Shouchella shacheensis]|uniref:sporulation protein YunB n=1 Tax=Shouchella shacheensis TaxID=1649580 RepID=UPI00073FD84B|nr:sporulation protein YunB [Shouchella shacheensis]